jgi:cytochrome c oxidase subunit 1
LLSTNHRVVGLQYFLTAMIFLFVGFVLMLLMRWQLAWPTSPMPGVFARVVGTANAPGGYMAPEFYNQLVAMHGTVMIFLAVVPLLTGAFGTRLVPSFIGAHSLAFPRLSVFGYFAYVSAGVLMLLGFVAEGGAANSGWTSYPPLAVLATRGQDFWLGGMLLLSLSTMAHAINVIVTVVQLRKPGLTMMQLPFFVWSQLVAALLLLLAFPALQAAGLLQLSDRLVGTSFFLPSGLVVSGVAVDTVSGGGNPLLWQHLFWFLGHPEVYVLILPAIGIVAEIIPAHTQRPLWGYRGMVAAVMFLGIMSMVVWAHHMFLTGMGTSLGTFFQITTMIISIPSVVLITSLVLSLWGGAIRFSTAMLFALAFLPMFGIGGLSGLPLGLAASDVMLHDTWYVVGHFHFLVAPGTVFAIFAGIYYWFPAVTGRALNHRLGQLHFWGSFITMTGIFLPMFTLGLRGVNRRLYDAGMQYAHAQDTLGIQVHMTWMAVALGVAQIPFLVNVALSLRGAATMASGLDRYEETAAYERESQAAAAIPWTYESRPDSRINNVRLGLWLFLASETMFFGSLYSAYVLLRTGATSWPDAAAWFNGSRALFQLGLLAVCAMSLHFLRSGTVPVGTSSAPGARTSARTSPGTHSGTRPGTVPGGIRIATAIASAAGMAFLAMTWWMLNALLEGGIRPSDNVAIGSFFVLIGVHAFHVAGGLCATLWIGFSPTPQPERARALALYWLFLTLIWIAIIAAFSF